MMTRLLIIFLLTLNASFYGQNTFLKTIAAVSGYTINRLPYCALDTLSNNSFVTVGSKWRSQNNPNDTLILDAYIQKTEISGLTKWFRMYHLNGYQLALRDVQVNSNKDLLCVGQTNDYGTPNGNIKHGIIMKTDSNGFVKWCKLYPCQKIFKVLKRSDGNFNIIASDSGSFYGKYIKVALLDPNGNTLWCKRLTPSGTNELYCVSTVEGKDKSLLINLNYERLVLLDSIGNHIKDITVAPSSWIAKGFHRAINNFNKGFYIVGFNKGSNTNLASTITKTDPMLNVIWSKSYESLNGDSEFHNIISFSNNNLLVLCEPENYGITPNLWRFGYALFDSTGFCRRSNLFMTDSWPILPAELKKLQNSNLLFTAYNNNESYFGIFDTLTSNFCKLTQINWSNVSNIAPITSNYFNCVNSTFNYSLVNVYTYQPFDLSITYYCSSGPTGQLDTTYAYIEENSISDHINVFPSPCADFLTITIKTENKESNYMNVKLLNTLGQTLFNNQVNLKSKDYTIDTRQFPNGIIYLVCEFENKLITVRKVVIQKE